MAAVVDGLYGNNPTTGVLSLAPVIAGSIASVFKLLRGPFSSFSPRSSDDPHLHAKFHPIGATIQV